MPVNYVHITEDLALDLEALYMSIGEAADPIRDALIKAIQIVKQADWDDLPVSPHGFTGTRFSFDFHPGYIFTFAIDTYRDERKQPIEQHYYLKNLLRKK
jgi:hypothetical protein